MRVAADVDKPGRFCSGFELERPREERSHLSTRHGLVRAVPQRTGRTPRSNTQIRQTLHKRRPPHRSIHIRETRRTHRSGILTVEDPHQPHRHDPTQQRLPRTEPPRITLRTVKDAISRQRTDCLGVNTGLRCVREPASRAHNGRLPPVRGHPNRTHSRQWKRAGQSRNRDPHHKNAATHTGIAERPRTASSVASAHDR